MFSSCPGMTNLPHTTANNTPLFFFGKFARRRGLGGVRARQRRSRSSVSPGRLRTRRPTPRATRARAAAPPSPHVPQWPERGWRIHQLRRAGDRLGLGAHRKFSLRLRHPCTLTTRFSGATRVRLARESRRQLMGAVDAAWNAGQLLLAEKARVRRMGGVPGSSG